MIEWRKFFERLLSLSESKHLTFLALIVGAAAGVAASLFIKLIEHVQTWVIFLDTWHASPWSKVFIVLVPGLGGLAGGWLVQRYAADHRGTATTQIIFSLRRRQGLIPGLATLIKTLASALTIGTGGSTGPEGPAAHIGAGLGSVIGRWRKLPEDYLKTLVAAGAAGGIAAVFNAPIAGVMYALEVVLRQMASQAFAVVVLSTVTASVVSFFLVGHRIFLQAPLFYTSHPAEWIGYLLLGILAAFAARFFTALYLYCEQSFARMHRLPLSLRAGFGGLMVGCLGFFRPDVLGAGHDTVVKILSSGSGLGYTGLFFATLLLEKMLATSCSLASGGSGGLFVPVLSMGAMLGMVVGKGMHYVLPQASPPWTYALLGMGAMFAGFEYAPFTSIMLLFEITGDYPIILPLMFCVGVTTLVSRTFDRESLDGHELKRLGVRLVDQAEWAVLEGVTAQQVMSSPVQMIAETATVPEISSWMARSGHTGVPVKDGQDQIVGLITFSDIKKVYESNAPPPETKTARDIMRRNFPTLHLGESLAEALRRMQRDNFDRILIIAPGNPLRAVGIITKSDLLKIYRRAIT